MRSSRPGPSRRNRGGRTASQAALPAKDAVPAVAPAIQAAGARRREKFHVSFALAGLLLYLWVIHYPAYPIAQTGIIIGLIAILFSSNPLVLPAPLWWFGAFVLWAGVGSFQSPHPVLARDGFIEYGKLWLIFLLGVNVAHNRRELRTLTICWLALYAIYPVRGTLFNILLGISEFGRYAWNNIFRNPNDLAALTIPMLALSIGLLQTERDKWVKRAAIVGAVLLPAIIFFTQSRGGILALFMFGALVLLGNRRRGRTLVLVLSAVGLIAIAVPSTVWSRLGGLRAVTSEQTIATADPFGSAQQRYEIWKVARAIAADYPVFGSGATTYPKLHVRYAMRPEFTRIAGGERDTHSTYLNALAESGAVGLFLFFGMLASVFIQGWRVIRRVRQQDPAVATQLSTLLFGLVAFLQASVFATTQHVVFLYLYIAIVCVYLRLAPPPLPAVRQGSRPARAAGRAA